MVQNVRTNFFRDDRIVLTLDAGGTNLVFSAIQSGREIAKPVTLQSYPANLQRCLEQIVLGFSTLSRDLQRNADAISFAFPGPADYKAGIIGDLPNFPAFRGGIPLGPYLRNHFHIPVFINNDGNLFALGEHTFGFLPRINAMLKERGSPKRFNNLIGLTLGTGFGCGLIVNGRLNIGDNANGGEIWLMRNGIDPELCNEGGIGRDKLKNMYAAAAGLTMAEAPEPRELHQIAIGRMEGNQESAKHAFTLFGRMLGEAIANTLTLIDGPVVIGGGLSGAWPLFMPHVMECLNGDIGNYDGSRFPRIACKAYFIEDKVEKSQFLEGEPRQVRIPGSEESVLYDLPRTALGITELGVSRAVALGAYVFALKNLPEFD